MNKGNILLKIKAENINMKILTCGSHEYKSSILIDDIMFVVVLIYN